MSGAPQGQTGGAIAGDAANGMAIALQAKQLKLQEIQTMADATLKRAEANKLESDTKTIEGSREGIIKDLKETARGKWIANNIEIFREMLFKDNVMGNADLSYSAKDDYYGEMELHSKSIASAQTVVPLIDVMIDKELGEEKKLLMSAQRAFTDTHTQNETSEVLIAYLNYQVAKANSDTQRMDAETKRLYYALEKFMAAYDVKLTNAQISEIVSRIENNQKLTDFQTGGWAKAGVVLGGAVKVGELIVGAQTAGAAKMGAKAAYNRSLR